MFNALITLVLLCGINAPEKKGTLIVEINGIQVTEGTIQLGIYNNAEGFPLKKKVYLGKVITANSKSVRIELPNLPHGEYAIAAYHDKNGNGKLDKNIFGVPTELYGFSNNARGIVSAPNFSDAKFTINSSTNKISFELK